MEQFLSPAEAHGVGGRPIDLLTARFPTRPVFQNVGSGPHIGHHRLGRAAAGRRWGRWEAKAGSRAGLLEMLRPRPPVAIAFLQSPPLPPTSLRATKTRADPTPGVHTHGARVAGGSGQGPRVLLPPPPPTPKFLLPIPEFPLYTLLFVC